MPVQMSGYTFEVQRPAPLQGQHTREVLRDLLGYDDATLDGLAAADVIRAASNADKALISDVAVFDVFEGASLGPGRKSLAIEVTLSPKEKTLTDAEIEAVGAKVIAEVLELTRSLAGSTHAARHDKVTA